MPLSNDVSTIRINVVQTRNTTPWLGRCVYTVCNLSVEVSDDDSNDDNLLQIETSDARDGEPPLCAGCKIRITDKFYLCAVEKKWHSSCLKCAECGAELENEASCFEREGQIYCRDDYLR